VRRRVTRDEAQNRGAGDATRVMFDLLTMSPTAIKRDKGAAGGDGIAELAIANCGAHPRGRLPGRRDESAERYVTDGGGRESRAEERQRQNATNSKRAEPCACIRNAIGPLSTGAGPLLSTGVVAGGRARDEGEIGRAQPAPSAPRAAGKF